MLFHDYQSSVYRLRLNELVLGLVSGSPAEAAKTTETASEGHKAESELKNQLAGR